jgi:hypothetical protein
MFDYRIFYPQIGIDEQNRMRRAAATASAHRVYRLPAGRREARQQGGRR